MSTVIGLGDLVEDEIIPIPIPMIVDVENIRLTLVEDRPPVNITSPGSNPINLDIGKMKITRDEIGIFHIQPVSNSNSSSNKNDKQLASEDSFGQDFTENTQRRERDRELLSLQLVMQQLKFDNENMKKTLGSLERNSENNK